MNVLRTEGAIGRDDLRMTVYAESTPRPNIKVRWRAVLRHDFYTPQCSFRVDRWDGHQWREAYTAIDYSKLRIMAHTASLTRNNPNLPWIKDAEADALDLLNIAASVVQV